MINLQSLNTVVRHPLFSILKAYPISTIAAAIKCNPSYLNNVLLGHAKASKAFEAKIAALAAEIQHAEAAQLPSTQSKESK